MNTEKEKRILNAIIVIGIILSVAFFITMYFLANASFDAWHSVEIQIDQYRPWQSFYVEQCMTYGIFEILICGITLSLLIYRYLHVHKKK